MEEPSVMENGLLQFRCAALARNAAQGRLAGWLQQTAGRKSSLRKSVASNGLLALRVGSIRQQHEIA